MTRKINWLSALFVVYIAAVVVVGAITLSRAAAF